MLDKIKGYAEARTILGDFDLAGPAHWVLVSVHWREHGAYAGVGVLELVFRSTSRQPNHEVRMRFEGVRDFMLDNREGREPEHFAMLWIRDRGWEDVSWEVGGGYSIDFLAKSAEITGVEEANDSDS